MIRFGKTKQVAVMPISDHKELIEQLYRWGRRLDLAPTAPLSIQEQTTLKHVLTLARVELLHCGQKLREIDRIVKIRAGSFIQ